MQGNSSICKNTFIFEETRTLGEIHSLFVSNKSYITGKPLMVKTMNFEIPTLQVSHECFCHVRARCKG